MHTHRRRKGPGAKTKDTWSNTGFSFEPPHGLVRIPAPRAAKHATRAKPFPPRAACGSHQTHMRPAASSPLAHTRCAVAMRHQDTVDAFLRVAEAKSSASPDDLKDLIRTAARKVLSSSAGGSAATAAILVDWCARRAVPDA